MRNFLRERVRERLDALGINAFEAARRIGAERTYVSELLSGKKEQIRPPMIAKLAAVFNCDPEYLIGAQDIPRRAASGGPDDYGLPIEGVCEAGVWRRAPPTPLQAAPVAPDPRAPAAAQGAYVVRGDHAAPIDIRDGDVVIAVAGARDMRDGDVVICRRVRGGDEMELTLARVVRGKIVPAGGGGEAIAGGDLQVIARAISAIKLL